MERMQVKLLRYILTTVGEIAHFIEMKERSKLFMFISAANLFLQNVHVHILPRKPGDFEQNDDIYDKVILKKFWISIYELENNIVSQSLFSDSVK